MIVWLLIAGVVLGLVGIVGVTASTSPGSVPAVVSASLATLGVILVLTAVDPRGAGDIVSGILSRFQ